MQQDTHVMQWDTCYAAGHIMQWDTHTRYAAGHTLYSRTHAAGHTLCRTDVMQDTHVMQQDTWVMQWDTLCSRTCVMK